MLGDIGFVGLGRMGTAMAANLAASGGQVIAYVRHPDHIDRLEALYLTPTTHIEKLFECKVVISMLPDDAAAHEVVFGRKAIGLVGLAEGMMPGAIHLSMGTISTAAASQLASERKSWTRFVGAGVWNRRRPRRNCLSLPPVSRWMSNAVCRF